MGINLVTSTVCLIICFDLFTSLLVDYVISNCFRNYVMNLQTPVAKSEILNDLYRQETCGNNFV